MKRIIVIISCSGGNKLDLRLLILTNSQASEDL